MDEPLSNLDAELRAQTRTEIVDLHRSTGVATICVTHDQVEAMTMSDRVALMLDGRILQIGSPRMLYDDPADLPVAQFLGSPRINALPATATAEGVRVADLVPPLHAAAPDRTALTLGLRPEALHLVPAGGMPATVQRLEFLGAELLLHARLADTPVIACAPANAPVRPGDAVQLQADWSAALLFDAAGRRLGV